MFSRRQFLSRGCAFAAAGASGVLPFHHLGLTRNAVAANTSGYRALVCIVLAGGNDSFNMLVPTDADQYGEYQTIRADLALDASSLRVLPGTTVTGRSYGLHPGMPELESLYTAGEAALLANVGSLQRPFDPVAYAAGNLEVPMGLFSHLDQLAQWETAVVDTRVAQGWAGRMADLMAGENMMNGISMNISLSGTNIYQSGDQASPYSIESSGNGAPGINAYDDGTEFGDFRKRMIDDLLATQYEHPFRREYAQRLRGAIDAQGVFVSAIESVEPPATFFSANEFSQGLRQIARTISVRDLLGVKRQTFYLVLGGWDHHDEVLDNQARLLPLVSAGLQEFRNAMVEMEVFDDVTTFTMSDFGRTLTSNGRGSDHGWGGHHIVMGGSVAGGQIYGEYPLLSATSPLDVGRGRYAPTTAMDEYFAELALWFGVDSSELESVLPNIRQFYVPGSSEPPMGFFG